MFSRSPPVTLKITKEEIPWIIDFDCPKRARHWKAKPASANQQRGNFAPEPKRASQFRNCHRFLGCYFLNEKDKKWIVCWSFCAFFHAGTSQLSYLFSTHFIYSAAWAHVITSWLRTSISFLSEIWMLCFFSLSRSHSPASSCRWAVCRSKSISYFQRVCYSFDKFI